MSIFSCQSGNKFDTPDDEKLLSSSDSTFIVEDSQNLIKSDTVYIVADNVAHYSGGLSAQLKFFNDEIKNLDSKESGFPYIVYLQFVVELDSSISNIRVRKGDNDSLNNEAIRIVKLAKWVPGKVKNTSVRSELFLPFEFISKND